jgi:glycosyltransferase involved in cell wall biosynthesis
MIIRPIISIVSPVYKADKILEKLVFEIQKTMLLMGVSYEIILIDDRSPDSSWKHSRFTNNFIMTLLRLAFERDRLVVFLDVNKSTVNLQPTPKNAYPTLAKRPFLDKSKIKNIFVVQVKDRGKSLKKI